MLLPLGRLLPAAVGAALALSATGALAQDWPTRPVTVVVTFAPGAADDVLARILAPRLSELLGQQVIVENFGGAAGAIAVNRVAKAAPDGYQLVLGGVGTFAVIPALYKKPPYDPINDFEPVMLMVDQPIVLVARKDLPANNLPEFVAYVRAHQATMQFGSAGPGSISQLSCEQIHSAIGVNVTHVPFRAAALAMQELIAGRLDYLCPLAATALPHIVNNVAKPIAMLSKNRSPIFPALATAEEQGVAGLEAYAWQSFFFPKGTPRPIVQKLRTATATAIDTAVVQNRLKEIGATVVGPDRRSQKYLQEFLAGEITKWQAIVKAANVKVE